jgi:hypothetical protein
MADGGRMGCPRPFQFQHTPMWMTWRCGVVVRSVKAKVEREEMSWIVTKERECLHGLRLGW